MSKNIHEIVTITTLPGYVSLEQIIRTFLQEYKLQSRII